jgi:hypothetical protein
MFLFGKKNFRIKTYSPYEVGISKNPNSSFNLELHQNYFHILGIPFFELGMSWFIRKGSTFYAAPTLYQQQIDVSKLRVSTPWRTFAGPITLMLGMVIFNVNLVWLSHQNNLRVENEVKPLEEMPEQKPEQKPDLSKNQDYIFQNNATDSLNN